MFNVYLRRKIIMPMVRIKRTHESYVINRAKPPRR